MAGSDYQGRGGLENLLRRFRRELSESGQLRDHRRKRYFVSKGESVREKQRRAESRRRRREFRLRQLDKRRE